MPAIALLAILIAAFGLVLVFSGQPDPWPYVGVALIATGPLIAIVVMIRSFRPASVLAFLLTLIPAGLFAWLLYIVATRAR